MFQTGDSPTANLTLDTTLARLANHPQVDGLLVMGSAGAGDMHPTSDYDVLVVLQEMSAPLRLALTIVERRLTEVYFTSSAALEKLAAEKVTSETDADNLRPAMTRWLQTGRIAFDRSGLLARARAMVASRDWFVAATGAEMYDRWAHTNYTVRQTRRMATADDLVYQMAVDLRLLYGLDDLKNDYFVLRQLPYCGEKEAVRYWMDHDPSYLRLFQETLSEADRACKVALYERLAELTLAPVGGLVPVDTISITLEREREDTTGAVRQSLALWRKLLGEDEHEASGQP